MIKFKDDATLTDDSVLSEQLHEDYPTKEAIDTLTIEQLKTLSNVAPFGYFKVSSSLSNYFFERLDPHMTDQDWKEHRILYRKIREDFAKQFDVKKEKQNGNTKSN